jgi:hypothetical protein
MAITKIQTGGIPALAVTHDKLHTDMDLSGKTVTLPTLSADLHISSTVQPTIRVTDSDNNNTAFMQADGVNGAYFGTLTNHPVRLAPNNSTKMIVTTDGNVGIGTASPGARLHAYTTGYPVSKFERYGSSAATRGSTQIGHSALGYGGTGADTYIVSEHGFGVAVNAGTNAFVITDGGKVGIGTSTPSSPKFSASASGILELKGSKPSFNIQESDVTDAHFNMSMSNGNAYLAATGTGNLIFATGTADWSERIRIDSSGNLLIGTTDINPFDNTTGSGIALRSSGAIYNAINNGTPLSLNRMGNDGTIAQFRKDGTTVGSIGIQGTGFYIDSEVEHAGIRFGGSAVVPRHNNAGSNNYVNLGDSSNRFKDAYIGGGIYLGGTGAANKLDDYEEGTWIPTLTSTGGTINSANTCGYIKIGRTVYLFGQARFTNPGNIGSAHAKLSTPTAIGNIFAQTSNDAIVPMWTNGAAASKNYWDEGYPSISMSVGGTQHHLYRHHRTGAEGLGGNDFGGELMVSFNSLYYAE